MEETTDRAGATREGEERGPVQSVPAQDLWRLEPRLDESGVCVLC